MRSSCSGRSSTESKRTPFPQISGTKADPGVVQPRVERADQRFAVVDEAPTGPVGLRPSPAGDRIADRSLALVEVGTGKGWSRVMTATFARRASQARRPRHA